MPPLHNPNNQQWVTLGEIQFGDPDGSISDNHDQGRDVYVFGVDPVENTGYIKKSAFGIDTAAKLTRVIDASEYLEVAYLKPGESHEMEVTTDISNAPRKIKFTFT